MKYKLIITTLSTLALIGCSSNAGLSSASLPNDESKSSSGSTDYKKEERQEFLRWTKDNYYRLSEEKQKDELNGFTFSDNVFYFSHSFTIGDDFAGSFVFDLISEKGVGGAIASNDGKGVKQFSFTFECDYDTSFSWGDDISYRFNSFNVFYPEEERTSVFDADAMSAKVKAEIDSVIKEQCFAPLARLNNYYPWIVIPVSKEGE